MEKNMGIIVVILVVLLGVMQISTFNSLKQITQKVDDLSLQAKTSATPAPIPTVTITPPASPTPPSAPPPGLPPGPPGKGSPIPPQGGQGGTGDDAASKIDPFFDFVCAVAFLQASEDNKLSAEQASAISIKVQTLTEKRLEASASQQEITKFQNEVFRFLDPAVLLVQEKDKTDEQIAKEMMPKVVLLLKKSREMAEKAEDNDKLLKEMTGLFTAKQLKFLDENKTALEKKKNEINAFVTKQDVLTNLLDENLKTGEK